jgi:DNA-binding transcriptional regulator YbjK/rhodanese-related sulfurtransferase
VAHRSVAARAGVPLAATTYYFSSLDDLVGAGLAELADGWLTAAQAVVERLPDRVDDASVLAQAFVDAVLGGAGQDDGVVLTMYERFLQAGRAPHLRSVVTSYGARLDAVLLEVLRRADPGADETTVHRVLTALDGTVLRALAEGRPVVPAATAAVLPLLPVPPSLDDLLDAARTGPPRRTPAQALAAVQRGALLVDTRTAVQRAQQGDLPGAVVVDRTVLEWRLDPRSPWRIPEATGPDLEVVVVCRQGYSSSLAAASLRALGLHRATDLEGGVEAWLAAGLPVTAGPADVRT